MNRFRTLSGPCLVFFCFYLFSSCSTSKNIDNNFLYFQRGLDSMGNVDLMERKIQPNDLLNIQVFSKSLNQEQTVLFNIPNNSNVAAIQGYQVNTDGYIEMPLIGKIQAASLTKAQLETAITGKLTTYVGDPSVIIRFMDFKVNVLGEVKDPGLHNFQTDRVTVIDAINASGDLTDYGIRNNIMVIREDSTIRKFYRIDLTSGSVFQSPGYQLHANDIVYVSANNKKLKEVKRPNQDLHGWQLAVSAIAVLSTLFLAIFTVSKN